MNYREALERLFALRRFGVRPGLEGISRALAAIGHPEEKLSVVHVAGTNGKGSTAAFSAELLGAANCRSPVKVGLYTSPHLLRFTERFQIGGVEISEEEAAAWVERLLPLELTFFELATAMALGVFAEKHVDVAVIEVGLGGRWDATNIFSRPLVSVVTGIALDHVEILGGTLTAIAREKAGIFKRDVPAVAACRDDGARAILEEEAERAGAELALLNRDFFPYAGPLGLLGAHQKDNAALALAAIARCPERFRAPMDAQFAALARTRWPGRMEQLAPDLIADGAHNPDGARALAEALPALLHGRPLTLVFGVVDDKDVANILLPLLPLSARVIFTRPPSPRALDPARLLALHPTAQVIDSPGDALAARSGVTVVCGSLFLVGEARRLVTGERADPIAAQDPAAKNL